MNRPPAFQFYAKDWLSSGKIATMTLEEEGAYIHLLAHCWLSDDCTLPDDDAELAQLSRMGERWFSGASAKLRLCFLPHPRKSGRIFNVRLLEERKKQEAWRRKSQEGGRRSAESRALRSRGNEPVVEGWLNGGARVVQPKGNSSSSSSYPKKEKNTPAALNGHQVGFDLFWKDYPKKRGKGRAEKMWRLLKPDMALVIVMLAKIKEAKQTTDWTKDGGQFIPYPEKWLHDKGWLDEYTASPKPTERIPL